MPRYREDEIDITILIRRIVPNAKWLGHADRYSQVVKFWEDSRPVPTWEEIEDEWDAYLAEGNDPIAEQQLEIKIHETMRELALKELANRGEI